MKKKKHAILFLTLLLCAVFAAFLPVVVSATAVGNFSSFTYASYFTADYTVVSTTGSASVSASDAKMISLSATGVNATSGCNSTPAVSSITTVTLTAKETVTVTCTPGSNVTMTPPSEVTSNSDGSKTFIVASGQKVSFSVTASNATTVTGSVTFASVETTTTSVPEDCAAYSYNNKVYNYLDKVIADATANGSGTIVVTASGKTYHSSVETDEDYAEKTFTFTIPKGVTLLLPYLATDTTIKSGLTSGADYLANGNYTFIGNTGGQQAPNSNVTYTLTVPSTVTLEVADGTAATVGNCGRIVVGGTIASGNGSTEFNGATRGAHSNLVVDGTLDLGNYAVLATTGYVLGGGNIKAEGVGAQIFQPYVVMDFPGAAVAAMSLREGSSGSTQPSGESKVAPYIYWGVVNIQAKLTMDSGNFMYAYATLGDDGNGYHTNAALVGDSTVPALLILDSDATFSNEFKSITWSGYSYGLLGRNQIRVEGGASMGSLKLELDVGAVDTASVVASIGYNMDVTLAKGHDYSINKSTMLLPGASLTVAEDATLTIGDSSAIRFAVWDGLIHRGYRNTTSGAHEIAAATTRYNKVNYPTNVELDKGGLSEDAEFVINGRLVIGANASIGGIIQTSNGGTVEVNSGATPSVMVQANILDRQFVNWNMRVMASMSMFDSAAKLNVGGTLTNIIAGKTYYGMADNTLTNSGFTNIYYPGYDSSGNRVASSNLEITYNSAETIKGTWSTEAPVQIMSGATVVQGYTTLNAAMADYPDVTSDKPYIQLNKLSPVFANGGVLTGNATMLSDVNLDMNGCSVSGNISGTYTKSDGTTGTYTLHGMDTATNAYDSTKAGTITGNISGTVKAIYTADRSPNEDRHYLAVPANGGTQFHRVAVAVTGIQFLKDAKNTPYIIFYGEYRGTITPTVTSVGFVFDNGSTSESVSKNGVFTFGYGTEDDTIISVTPQVIVNNSTVDGILKNSVVNILKTTDEDPDTLTFAEVFTKFEDIFNALSKEAAES